MSLIDLTFNNIEGRHTACEKNAFVNEGGVIFLQSVRDSAQRTYDPLKNYDDLLLDIVKMAHIILECSDFWAFCVERGGERMEDTIFWTGYDDFFTQKSADARKIMQALTNFAGAYGIPEWTGNITIDIPDQYVHLLGKYERPDFNSSAYASYKENQKMMANKEIIPAGTMAFMLVDYYNRFLLQKGNTYIHLDRIGLTFQHDSGRDPKLCAKGLGLVSCINLGYVMLVSGRKGAVRQCKHCGNYFIADDLRAEYCSKKCRGAYNSAMTRKRKKESDE